jgi:putative hydrolase
MLILPGYKRHGMKNWERYRAYLESGDFHVHSDYTEGSNSVSEMCEQALINNLKLICFSEHVRKELLYDYGSMMADIERARKRYPRLRILSGCEAKVLDREGSLDVSADVLEKAEIVIASFHSFHYGRKQDFIAALAGALRNPRTDIWGHPATFLRNVELTEAETASIIRECMKRRVLVEDSLSPAYSAPGFIERCRDLGAETVRNSDAHCREDIKVA